MAEKIWKRRDEETNGFLSVTLRADDAQDRFAEIDPSDPAAAHRSDDSVRGGIVIGAKIAAVSSSAICGGQLCEDTGVRSPNLRRQIFDPRFAVTPPPRQCRPVTSVEVAPSTLPVWPWPSCLAVRPCSQGPQIAAAHHVHSMTASRAPCTPACLRILARSMTESSSDRSQEDQGGRKNSRPGKSSAADEFQGSWHPENRVATKENHRTGG